MAIRFRRSVTIVPGVRINIGKRGASLSAGPRGSSVTVGRQGVFGNVGLPGTGFSVRKRIDNRRPTPTAQKMKPAQSRLHSEISMHIDSDGQAHFSFSDGTDLNASELRRFRGAYAAEITAALTSAVQRYNRTLEACLNLHEATPVPDALSQYPIFDIDPPSKPVPLQPTRWDRLLDPLMGGVRKIEAQNQALASRYNDEAADWHSMRNQFHARLDAARAGQQDSMESLLGLVLSRIEWPKETHVSFDFGDDSSTLALDIDLPDADDMPHRSAVVPSRGVNLQFKARSEAQRRRDFSQLAHGTLFRVVGEAFASLPTVNVVTASAYLQRINQATGVIDDVYVLSFSIERAKWVETDFSMLSHIDPIAALERGDLRRLLDRSHTLRAINPH